MLWLWPRLGFVILRFSSLLLTSVSWYVIHVNDGPAGWVAMD